MKELMVCESSNEDLCCSILNSRHLLHNMRVVRESTRSSYLRQVVGYVLPSPTSHTMSYALVEYCSKRLPMEDIMRLRSYGIPLELHAVPSQILETRPAAFGFDRVERLLWRYHNSDKLYNHIRPELVLARESDTGRRVVLLTLMPGSDYFRHVASMLLVAYHANDLATVGTDVKCVLYPMLTQSVMSWTGLTDISSVIQPGDIVVLGFVAELLLSFRKLLPSSNIIDHRRTPYNDVVRLEIRPGLCLGLVGVNYSYWGNLGGIVVENLALRHPRAICYIAKQGTLLSPNDIHHRIYSPTRYIVFDRGELVWIGDQHPALPANPISSRYPCFDRGLHVSTPTIVEQDFHLRERLSSHGVVSIDNELSQMARALTNLHERYPLTPPVQLLPLMFVTDYLRRPDELNLRVPFDLTSHNATVASNKARFIARAAHLVLEAFSVLELPRAAIVGTGYGIKTILPALRRRGVEILRLCGGADHSKTATLALRHSVPCVDLSLPRLRARGADLLFIASPHSTHADLVRQALAVGGFDIVCEKPLALSIAEISELVAACPPPRERLTLVNHALRFYPPFSSLKTLIGSGKGLTSIDIRFLTQRLRKQNIWNWCFSRAEGGGMLLAMATHFLDLVEWIADAELGVDSMRELDMGNSVGLLRVKDSSEERAPDVESWFRMKGIIGTDKTEWVIDCDGAADEELFVLSLTSQAGDEMKIVQKKGTKVEMFRLDAETEQWMPLKLRLEERVETESMWKVAFEIFVEDLVEAICMGERETFARRATNFSDYRRQVEIFGHKTGIL